MYKISLDDGRDRKIVVVGCGGTGSLVSEGLCRLLDPGLDLLLIDMDRVEPHNLRRQNFFQGDIGKFKSQALAERLSRMYGRRIGYSVFPYERGLLNESFGGQFVRTVSGIIIGCVDNAAARKSLSKLDWGDWWLDAGNGFHSGQVLIGNAAKKDRVTQCFDEATMTAHNLPAPNLQLPSLLIPPTEPIKPRDCAQAVEAEEQSPVVNQAMATLVLDFVYKLFRGELTWLGAYLDLEAGTLSTVPAEPITVARMMSVRVDTLMIKKVEEFYRPFPPAAGS